jgi:hypothetical protein
MSSTNRAGHVPHPEGDYATPIWCTKLVLPLLPTPYIVLDPCAGKGNILKAVSQTHPHAVLLALELNEERAKQCETIKNTVLLKRGNALSPKTQWTSPDGQAPDLILTNPPFVLAESFLRRALHEVHPNGTVCMLLPVPFVSASSRRGFWLTAALERNSMGADMHVLTKRPSFTKVGTSSNDSVEYAWFVFNRYTTGKWYRLEVDEEINPVVKV